MFRQELASPLSRIDLFLDKGQLGGYLCSLFVAGELTILNVVTAPRMRRRGVARTLLNNAIERSRHEGLEKAFLEVRRSNRAAIALYETFGFRTHAVRRKYYADGEDALLMDFEPSRNATVPGGDEHSG